MKGQAPSRPTLSISNPSVFLRSQVEEDSNHELDWLWTAQQVTAVQEIYYCLERALYINPNNRDTQRTLSKLMVQRANKVEPQPVHQQALTQPSSH